MHSIFKYPGWLRLKGVGQSKVLKTSRFWLVFIPLAAKALELAPGSIQITPELILNLSLPFSWKIFYFSAVAFALAGLIFDFKCPSLIKKYADFPAYVNDGHNLRQLIFEKKKALIQNREIDSDLQMVLTRYFLQDFTNWSGDERELGIIETDKSSAAEVLVPELGSAFHDASHSASYAFQRWRFVCAALYFIGFLLLGIVMFENFYFVMRQIV